jgi:hypothetical protein
MWVMGEAWILVSMMGGANVAGLPLVISVAHVALIEPAAGFEQRTGQVNEGWKLTLAGAGSVSVLDQPGLLERLGLSAPVQAAMREEQKRMKAMAHQALLAANTQAAKASAGQNGGVDRKHLRLRGE